MYRGSHDPVHLRALGRFRTDAALQALLGLAPSCRKAVETTSIATSKVPVSLLILVTHRSIFKTYRGRVVSEARIPMGVTFPAGFPRAPFAQHPQSCSHPRGRQTRLGGQTTSNPTFFWIRCPHPQDYVVTRFTANGVEGVMTPTSQSPAAIDLIPGELALQVEVHTNQFGYGMEITPGYSLHQVGGYPPWVTPERFPRCPDCGQGMRYLMSVDTGMTPFGELPLGGMLYGFCVETCSVSATMMQ